MARQPDEAEDACCADESATSHRVRSRLDVLGAAVSGACAVHCALAALAPALLVLMGLGALLGERTEWAFTLSAVAIGAVAAVLAHRAGRSWWIVAGFGVAIALVVGGRLAEHHGIEGIAEPLAVTGGLALAAVHLLNLRTDRQARAAR